MPEFVESSDGRVRNGVLYACDAESPVSSSCVDHGVRDLFRLVQEALHMSADLCVQTL